MKQIIITVACLFGLSTFLEAQQTSYTVLYDQPMKPWLSVNLDLFQMDMGVANIDGTSFNIGTYGYVEPVEKIGAQYNFKQQFFGLGRIGFKDYPANTDLSLGGYYSFRSREKTKQTKVVLKTEYKGSTFSTNVSGDRVETYSEEITYLMIPAKRLTEMAVRGGFYFKRGAFNYGEYKEDDLFEESSLEELSLTSAGLYVGLLNRSLKNVFISTDEYGTQFNSIGDDFAFDLLLVPVNKFKDLNNNGTDVTQLVKTTKGTLPIGFRIGWYRYQIEGKAKTGKKFGSAISAEGGYKPYQGFFMNASYAITLVKSHKTLGNE